MRQNHHSPILLAALLAAVLVPGALLAQGRNNINHEPVFLYDVSGGTFAGPIQITLAVYSNGEATLAQEGAVLPEQICEATLRPDQLRSLQNGLRRAGAFQLRDGPSRPVPDLPLTTVTFFLNAGQSGRSTANTFSYFEPTGRYATVEDIIQDFIDTAFAGC